MQRAIKEGAGRVKKPKMVPAWGFTLKDVKKEINQSINQSSLTSVSSSEDDFGDALSGHSKINTHNPCDENTDPLTEMPVPVPKSNKSVLKEREKL